MKGSPMYRNFGIGAPTKQFEEGDYYDTRSKSPSKQFEEGDYYDTRSKSPNKQTYDANGTDERVYDVGQRAYDKWRGTEDINTGEKGKAPNIRYLGSKENKKHLDAYLAWKKSGAELPTRKSGKTVKNPGAAEKGPEVTTTKTSTSPNKQTHYGGTESEKGNIFTKKGREQRKVNRYKKSSKRLLDNANKEGFDTKKSKKLMKKTKKRLSKTSQLHQDVQSGKKVIYKGGDPKDNSNYISNQN